MWWWMQAFPFALYRSSHPAESFRPWEGPHLWRRHPDGCLQQWCPFLQLTLLYRGPKRRYIIVSWNSDGNLVGKMCKMIIHMGGYGVLLLQGVSEFGFLNVVGKMEKTDGVVTWLGIFGLWSFTVPYHPCMVYIYIVYLPLVDFCGQCR